MESPREENSTTSCLRGVIEKVVTQFVNIPVALTRRLRCESVESSKTMKVQPDDPGIDNYELLDLTFNNIGMQMTVDRNLDYLRQLTDRMGELKPIRDEWAQWIDPSRL